MMRMIEFSWLLDRRGEKLLFNSKTKMRDVKRSEIEKEMRIKVVSMKIHYRLEKNTISLRCCNDQE